MLMSFVHRTHGWPIVALLPVLVPWLAVGVLAELIASVRCLATDVANLPKDIVRWRAEAAGWAAEEAERDVR